MNSSGTGLIENLKLLYRNYGGWRSFVSSEYLWLSVILAVLCWPWIYDERWTGFAQAALPTLAGFSIAAYAIFFAILDEKARTALKAPAPTLGGRSPLLALASTVSHTVVIQIFALIFSIVFASKPFPTLPQYRIVADVVNTLGGCLGGLTTIYGVVLVLSSVLSVFRILEIGSKV